MVAPGYKTFVQMSREATLVPVAKTLSADLLTPVGAFLSVAVGQKYSFLLESVEGGERIGRYTFVGAQPRMVVTARGKEISIRCGREFEITQGHVIVDLPDCIFTFYDRLLAFDHLKHQLHIIALADVRSESPRKAYDRALADIDMLEQKLVRGIHKQNLGWSASSRGRVIKVRTTTRHDEFLASVRRAKEYIAAGDIFQVVLSMRLDFKPQADPFQIYRSLRTVNPSPYMFYLQFDDTQVLGASPEMLVRITGRNLEYRPIAGTRRRGEEAADDERLIDELRKDEKERAEHVMLVDLGRNDLGRVSDYGTVRVRDLMYVEKYSHVMHLVSALEGQLRSELDPLDAVAACFPAGTLSGAPKMRAMEIIEELEPARRGVYGGAILYADYAGNLDSCIAIRTMVVHRGRAYVQAGAGIVADSDPESEYQECVNKARALLRAAEAATG